MSDLNVTLVQELLLKYQTESAKAGDTAWMLTSAALVFWMTPGLSLFYGGLIHRKNVVNGMQMSFAAIAVITCLWFICGYSFAFGPGDTFMGDGTYAVLKGVGEEPNDAYSATIPHSLFMVYQLMFAIITPALISGAIVERMSFRAYMIYLTLWALIVYNPVAHWSWAAWSDGNGAYKFGWLRTFGVLDFAGGNVVHAISGFSALVAAYMVGPRRGYPNETSPAHNLPLVVLGTSMLWVGWYGFNGGSALASNYLATHAFVNTHLSASSAFLTWTMMESIISKPSIAGACTGAVVGLVVITPGAGFVPTWASIIIGIVGTLASFLVIYWKHKYLGQDSFAGRVVTSIDDSLDAFACHGVGGVSGSILTGLFASKDVNPLGADGAFFGNPKQLGIQIASTIVCVVWSVLVSFILLIIIKYTVGLRVPESIEREGLDVGEHGEIAYHLINREFLMAQFHGTHEKQTNEHEKPEKSKSKQKAKETADDTEMYAKPGDRDT